MKFILGKKLGMTQVFREDGTVVPVTRVQAGPCVVTQVKRTPTDRVNAVQLGFGAQKMFRHNKPQQGHLKGLDAVKVMRDVPTNDDEHGLNRGDVFTASIFEVGEKVQVTGRSKGKGFQGVVKRHNFAGSPASHGHKDQLRMPGSIGATGPARVFKGTRMPGHMGDDKVTVKNLEILEVNAEANELLIKGAIPGARGGLVLILTPEGKIEIAKAEVSTDAAEEKPAVEEKKTESTEDVEKAPVKTDDPSVSTDDADSSDDKSAEDAAAEDAKK